MYLDTSVAVKLYCREEGSEECEAIAATADGFFSSELLYGELFSALLAKERSQLISKALRERIWSHFESQLTEGQFQLIPLNGVVVREASEVMAHVHPEIALRMLDAIHLATCLSVDAGPLFSNDRRMIDSAAKLGIALARR